MFSVTGVIQGETEILTYTWENGRGTVAGGPMALFLMRSALEREDSVGLVGQELERDLDEPLAALYMIMECFEEISGWDGELPEAEAIPEGAIG